MKTASGYWDEIWRHRHLFWLLVWRNFTLRYKQAFLGIAWGIIRPLALVFVFTFVFHTLIRSPSQDVPYVLLVVTAIVPWNFFAMALSEASTSLIANQQIISKVYIPRILFPLAAIAVNFIDCVIALAIIMIIAMWWNILPTTQILLLPALLALLTFLTIGIGVFLAALNIRYRDVYHFLPIALQIGILISPIGFTSARIPLEWRTIFFLNPIATLSEGFRWSILHTQTGLDEKTIGVSFAIGIIIAILGIMYFQRTEGSVADFL